MKIVGTVPLNDASTLRQRQRSMSSERGDEGEGAEGMESLEEPLRQSKPSLRRESRQGTPRARRQTLSAEVAKATFRSRFFSDFFRI